MSAQAATTSRDIPSLYRIDPLDGTNYMAWKFKMELILEDQGLYEHLTSTRPDWDKLDRSARTAICLRVSDSQLVHTIGTKTAGEIWKNLADIHEASGPMGIVNT
ncbi:hypothetical protein AURDEDRAFT_77595, partial [Auricularia subglabra TFB-10046 SS5]